MLLIVRKFNNSKERDANGAIKMVPGENTPIMKESIFDEAIDVWLIKSIRPFLDDERRPNVSKLRNGVETSVIYFKPGKNQEKIPEMHVVGNFRDLVRKVNELRGNNKESGKDDINPPVED